MSDMPDLSMLFSLLSNANQDPKNQVLEDTPVTSQNSSSESTMPDMETIMKLMKLMKSTNDNSPSKELLMSLKPFLNDSRKSKVDQYIKILRFTKFMEIFNEMGENLK